jgi:hypothetical protein
MISKEEAQAALKRYDEIDNIQAALALVPEDCRAQLKITGGVRVTLDVSDIIKQLVEHVASLKGITAEDSEEE